MQILANKSGQTLIETLAAVFILVMGVSAAVGLAIYAFNTSGNINKEITATGLAREGVEAVENMRDTNWLVSTLGTPANGNGCYNYATGVAGGANCYPTWLSQSYCLEPTAGTGGCNSIPAVSSNFIVYFDASNAHFFQKSRSTLNGFLGYGLTFDPANSGSTGFYSAANSGGVGLACADGATANGLKISDYCRKVVITKYSTSLGNAVAPYNQDPNLPLVKVQSQVWWVDKSCPRSADWPGLGKCSIELDTYLTNWKDY